MLEEFGWSDWFRQVAWLHEESLVMTREDTFYGRFGINVEYCKAHQLGLRECGRP
jgi:hypothetical protein